MIKIGDIFKYKVGVQFPWTVIEIKNGIVHFEKTEPVPNQKQALFKKMKECFVLEKMTLIK